MVEDDDEFPDVARKGYGSTWLGGGSLPLSPPGRGGGAKPVREPVEGAFRASIEREKARTWQRSPAEHRELDLAKLEALDESADGLTEWEAEAFPDMLARLEKGSFPLTEKQRAKVDEALDRLGIEVELPDVPGIR